LGLDLGLGIASGFVTVGVIGGAQRLEYAAVGPAVNLAARLCSRAAAGQILVDQRVVGAAGNDAQAYHFEKLESAELKGVARAVTIFAVVPSAVVGSGPQ
jgi:class 3 adenylate cyclase